MERHIWSVTEIITDRLGRLNQYTGDGAKQNNKNCLVHPAFQHQQNSIMEIFNISTFDDFILFLSSTYLIIYTVWAIGISIWYNRSIKKIDQKHKIEMQKIADEHEQTMQRIRDEYKQSIANYDLMRKIRQ